MLESLRLALRHVEVGRALYVCHLTGMADGWGWLGMVVAMAGDGFILLGLVGSTE